MRKLVAGTLLLFFGMATAHAQTYSPDRPGFGNGSSITPEKMLGVETGIAFTTSEFINQYDIGQVLLRYGITDKLELRAALNSYSFVDIDGPINFNYDGFNDMGLGAKYQFIDGTDNTPSLSALVELNFPVGSEEFTSDEITSFLGILSDYDLNDMWSISSNLAYSFDTENVDNDYWIFTFTPGFTLPGNEQWAGYFGYAGFYYEGGSNNWIEAGITYSLYDSSQLDMNVGYESDMEIFFIGAGYARGFN